MSEIKDEIVQVRMTTEMYDFIEKYRIENSLNDKPDVVRKIINKEINNKKSFFDRLKDWF